jgi:hypothetical protein
VLQRAKGRATNPTGLTVSFTMTLIVKELDETLKKATRPCDIEQSPSRRPLKCMTMAALPVVKLC